MLETPGMSPTARLHFTYIVSILVAVMIGQATVQLANNDRVVAFISFALTLASILLAVVAMVYSFISNASLSQTIGSVNVAAAEIRSSAAAVDRVATTLGKQVGEVSEKVVETHELVMGLSTPSAPVNQEKQGQKPLDDVAGSVVERSAPNGNLAMYAAAVAYRSGRSFKRDEVFALLTIGGNERYFWGWLMAIKAVGLIDFDAGNDEWKIRSFSRTVLEDVMKWAAEDNTLQDKIAKVDEYFAKPAK